MRLVPVFDINDVAHRRIKDLWQDGFVTMVPIRGEREGIWTLTDKGWRCLFACADRPVKPSRDREVV